MKKTKKRRSQTKSKAGRGSDALSTNPESSSKSSDSSESSQSSEENSKMDLLAEDMLDDQILDYKMNAMDAGDSSSHVLSVVVPSLPPPPSKLKSGKKIKKTSRKVKCGSQSAPPILEPGTENSGRGSSSVSRVRTTVARSNRKPKATSSMPDLSSSAAGCKATKQNQKATDDQTFDAGGQRGKLGGNLELEEEEKSDRRSQNDTLSPAVNQLSVNCSENGRRLAEKRSPPNHQQNANSILRHVIKKYSGVFAVIRSTRSAGSLSQHGLASTTAQTNGETLMPTLPPEATDQSSTSSVSSSTSLVNLIDIQPSTPAQPPLQTPTGWRTTAYTTKTAGFLSDPSATTIDRKLDELVVISSQRVAAAAGRSGMESVVVPNTSKPSPPGANVIHIPTATPLSPNGSLTSLGGIGSNFNLGASILPPPITRLLERINGTLKLLKLQNHKIDQDKSSHQHSTATLGYSEDTPSDPGRTELEYDREGDSSPPLLSPMFEQSTLLSPELSKKMSRHFQELKRMMDKEGSVLSADSTIQKAFFSKARPNVNVLLRCLKLVPDIEISTIIISILLKTVTPNSANILTPPAIMTSPSVPCLKELTSNIVNGAPQLGQPLTQQQQQSSFTLCAPGSADSASSNTTFLLKKNVTVCLLGCLQLAYKDLLTRNRLHTSPGTPAPTVLCISDELVLYVLQMLIRISKTDVKAAMLARLHGAIEILIDFLKRWQNLTPHALYIGVPISPVMETQEMVHRKMISAAYQVLKLWASKSDNNLLCLYRAGLIDVIASVVQSKPTVSTVPQHGSASAWANILEALAVVAKNKNALLDVLRVFGGMTFFIKACSPHFGSTTLWKCQELGEAQVDGVGTDESDREKPLNFSKRTKGDNLLKGALRFLKTAVETDEGKKAFIDAGGQDALISVLGSIVQELDMSSTVTSQNSIPGMVMAVLRAGANPSELPFQERMQARSFQLPPPLDSPEEDVFSSIEKDSQFVKRMEALLPEQHLNDAFVASPLFASESHTNRGHGTPSLCPVRMVQPANRAIDRHKMQVCPSEQELQYRRPPSALKKVLFEQTSQIRKGFNPNGSQQSLVYDVMDQRSAEVASKDPLTLQFDSRFESGNLQFAVKVSNTEYNLILQSDINTEIGKHNQWFYFSVRKMVANCVYRFNIINMSKNSSQFNYGMQPVMYSKCENCWRRIGDTVCYFRNNYRKNVEAEEVGDEKADAQESNAESSKAAPTYSTLMFTVVFKQENDTCFLAYHYPYTLSDLQDFLNASYAEKTFHMRCRWQELCRSLGNNRCDLLTITDFGPESVVSSPVESRRYIPLMARVHPGESNASYIMKGIISFLLSDDDQASFLRKKCVFKIVPMLNPDGVVNGSHRCSLAGVDLNRQWVQPSERQTPTIYWTKTLWRYLVHRGIRPFLSCDFHGHSRRKNVFVFGVENGPGIHEGLEKVFPQLMSEVCPVFDLGRSKYNVERSKEATARVVLCRELGVLSSYTLESTFNGFDTGPFKGQQIQIGDLEKVGTDFCRAIFEMILVFDSAGVACLTSTNSGMPQSVNDDISNANWQASGKGFKSKV